MYIVFYSQIFTHTAVSPTLSAVYNFFCLILEVSSPFFKKFKKYTVSYILRVIINKNSGIYMLYTVPFISLILVYVLRLIYFFYLPIHLVHLYILYRLLHLINAKSKLPLGPQS